MKNIGPVLCTFLVLLALFISTVGSGVAKDIQSHKIIGTHYTGKWWAPAFWSNIDTDDLSADFARIKENGFNTIILLVPWAGFQVATTPPTYNEEYFHTLTTLMQKAADSNLSVMLRIGYAHEIGDIASVPDLSYRKLTILSDPQVKKSWSAYLQRLNTLLTPFANFHLAFLTWEDFFLLDYMQAPADIRLQLAHTLKYNEFIQKYSLDMLSETYGRPFPDYDAVPIPANTSPAVSIFHEFWDEYLLQLFSLSQKILPKLSMEVRVDCDPANRTNGYICHNATFDLNRQSDTTVLYYTAAWGAANNGDLSDASDAVLRLRYLLDTVQSATDNGLFIDQFNFVDNTPGFEKNTRIKPDQVSDFLLQSIPLFQKKSLGYALWGMDDLVGNVIANSSFENGKKGWQLANGEHHAYSEKPESFYIELFQGGAISREYDMSTVCPGPVVQHGTMTVQFMATPIESASTEITLTITDSSGKERFTAKQLVTTADKKMVFEAIPVVPRGRLTITNGTQPVAIDDVELFYFVQRTGIYDEHGKPRPYRDALLQLNKQLQATGKPPEFFQKKDLHSHHLQGVYADGWAGKNVSGLISVPLDLGRQSTFVLEVYIPESWHNYSNSLTLHLGGVRIGEQQLTSGYHLLKFTPPQTLPNGQQIDFSISSKEVYLPSIFQAETEDSRELSFNLLTLGFPVADQVTDPQTR